MSARVLLDTNVLVYAHDDTEPVKQRQAVEYLAGLASSQHGALSAQVLGEYLSVVTRRFPQVIEADGALHQLTLLASLFEVHDTTLDVVVEAARGMRRYGFAFYDAQIWAVARLHHIPVVASEDFASGSEIEGVSFVNPFAG